MGLHSRHWSRADQAGFMFCKSVSHNPEWALDPILFPHVTQNQRSPGAQERRKSLKAGPGSQASDREKMHSGAKAAF